MQPRPSAETSRADVAPSVRRGTMPTVNTRAASIRQQAGRGGSGLGVGLDAPQRLVHPLDELAGERLDAPERCLGEPDRQVRQTTRRLAPGDDAGAGRRLLEL